ncbi:hypothetical protein [uncultured Helicobacter sp.]|uniref:hypothetical protein n=1 Tax=uncultured Helicobacter sp. TaxID=175537 RepID=UPI003752EE4C
MGSDCAGLASICFGFLCGRDFCKLFGLRFCLCALLRISFRVMASESVGLDSESA